MPCAADLLLAAADRRSLHGEDRLTEIFASVLQSEPELARWWLKIADLQPPTHFTHEVHTQLWLDCDKRPDMRVAVWNDRGESLGHVWSEHKTWTDFHYKQLSLYPESAGSDSRWIGLVRQDRKVPPDYRRVSWDDVAAEVYAIGSGDLTDGRPAGRAWRRHATGPAAPARLRVLHEFLSYLERNSILVAEPHPIEHLDVLAYEHATTARASVERLFRSACSHLRTKLPPELGDLSAIQHRGAGDSWYVTVRGNSWAAADPGVHDAYFEFLVSPHDSWRSDMTGQPAFGAGLTFSHVRRRVGWPAALDPSGPSEWVRNLRTQGITVGTTGDSYGRCFCTCYLVELMGMGTSVDEQALGVAKWAAASITRISDQRPPLDFTDAEPTG